MDIRELFCFSILTLIFSHKFYINCSKHIYNKWNKNEINVKNKIHKVPKKISIFSHIYLS